MKAPDSWPGWAAAVIIASLALIGRIETRAADNKALTDRVNIIESQQQAVTRGLSDYQAVVESRLREIQKTLDTLRVEVCESRGGRWRNGECR
jgi:hypothetical protein